MRLEFAHLRENIEAEFVPVPGHPAEFDLVIRHEPHLEMRASIDACGALIEVARAWVGRIDRCLPDELPDEFEVTHGSEIRQIHPTSEHTPKGLLCIATDGERADGRLAWVPGA